MNKPNVEDYLKQGMYGPKVTNPDERREFLGTIRERIEIALTQGQVMEQEIFPEVEEAMKTHSDVQLLLNGHIDYRFLSKYVEIANKYSIPFRIDTNNEHNSEIGLVVTHKEAVNKENIYVKKRAPIIPKQKEKKKGLFSFFKKR